MMSRKLQESLARQKKKCPVCLADPGRPCPQRTIGTLSTRTTPMKGIHKQRRDLIPRS